MTDNLLDNTKTSNQALARHTPKELVKSRMGTMLKVIAERDRQRFEMAALAVCQTPLIAKCDPQSVYTAIFNCFRLNLIPDPVLKQAYIVPFKSKATVVLGYNGVIDLARNAEPGLEVRTGCIYDNDEFTYRDGLDTTFEVREYHWQKQEEPGELVFAYCIYRLPQQIRGTMVVVPRYRLDKIKASKGENTPWHDPDSFPAMCEKTAIKRASKLWTLSPNKRETAMFREAINRIDEAAPEDLPLPPDEENVDLAGLADGEVRMGAAVQGDDARPVKSVSSTVKDGSKK